MESDHGKFSLAIFADSLNDPEFSLTPSVLARTYYGQMGRFCFEVVHSVDKIVYLFTATKSLASSNLVYIVTVP